MKLYHYYEKEMGPFVNLSDLTLEEAENVLSKLRCNKKIFASERDVNYMKKRFEYEYLVRDLFQKKNGKIFRKRPHYTLGECSWIEKWYQEGLYVSIDLNNIYTESISFTYGDMFPVFGPRGDDSAWYRKKVYTYEEIIKIVEKYGLPQENNPNGENGPIRYIEAQIWDDRLINTIIKLNNI